jgi:TatD DNase family protein
MILTDSHAHLYLEQFDADRHEVIRRAIDQGVRYMILPNIDKESIGPMMQLAEDFPENCFPMMGLHPTSVGRDYTDHLRLVKEWLSKEKFYAIGEMGIDLYWDKTFIAEQQEAFRQQVQLALEFNLPLVMHSRNSMKYSGYWTSIHPELKGFLLFYRTCQAEHITGMGFRWESVSADL